MATPAPGSHKAARMGCKCNMLLNQMGLGVGQTGSNLRQYQLDPECPIHQHTESYYEPPDDNKPKVKPEPRVVKTRGQVMIEGAVRRVKVMFHPDDSGRNGQ